MYTLNQFKELPINEGLDVNEINRKYFVYKSDYFYRNRTFSTTSGSISTIPPSSPDYVISGYVDEGYVD